MKAAPAKPGYLTTEFWVMVLTAIGSLSAAASGSLPNRYAAFATAASGVAYMLSRGIAKN